MTAFGAFPNVRTNPTAIVAARLPRHAARFARLGIDLRVALLPVRYDWIETALPALVARHRPDVILHLGVAARRKRICVETRAINRAGPIHPDAAGRLPRQRLDARGPMIRKATYPAARILAAMRGAGIAATRSIDAGDYVCNATLFRSLSSDLAPEIGFVHVPRLRRTNLPLGRAAPRPAATALLRAVLLALSVLARPPVP